MPGISRHFSIGKVIISLHNDNKQKYGPVSIALPWFNPDVPRYEYNPEKAKELLAEVGYEPGDIKLKLYTNESTERVRIVVEATLSFLGLGAQPPTISWGRMLALGRDSIRPVPYITLFPGLAIVFTVLGFNLLGDGLRDLADPQLRGR